MAVPMIKAKGETEQGDAVYVFGLNHEDLAKLGNGQYLQFDLTALGLSGYCVILGAPTDDDITETITNGELIKTSGHC